MEAHSETQPSWLQPTSVGFATSARAKCAFIVLQKIQRDFPLIENQVGTPEDGATAVNLSESTLRLSTMSTAIFSRLTYCVPIVKGAHGLPAARSFWNDSGFFPDYFV
jgi:hypothetical protein